MVRCGLCCVVAALVLAPAAYADGPTLGATEGGFGAESSASGQRYVTLSGAEQTTLETIRAQDGMVLGYTFLQGSWGIPTVSYDGSTAGVSADGRTLVLEDGLGGGALRRTSSFLVIDARQMRQERLVRLHGDFSVDAVSPHGRTLYLIQHVSRKDLTRYVVRAYDLQAGRLLLRTIADRTQRGWVMSGLPLRRVTSSDGRWVYTLYANYGGTPFVHALDTVRGTAHCVGIPWHESQDRLLNLRLSLRNAGRTLAFTPVNHRPALAMDTRTFRLSYSTPPSGRNDGRPWTWVALGVAVLIASGAVLRISVHRRPKQAEVAAT